AEVRAGGELARGGEADAGQVEEARDDALHKVWIAGEEEFERVIAGVRARRGVEKSKNGERRVGRQSERASPDGGARLRGDVDRLREERRITQHLGESRTR